MKIRQIGIAEADTEYGVFKKGDVADLPDEVASSFLVQIGMWEKVDEATEKKKKGGSDSEN